LHKFLADKNNWAQTEIKKLDDQFRNKQIPDSTHKRKVRDIKANKLAPTVLLKTDDKATYKNVIDVIDELNINLVGKYVVVDILKSELDLIVEKTGVKMNTWNDATFDNRNDLVFEGRNQAYGAYELRKKYNKRVSFIVGGMFAFSILLFGAKKFIDNRPEEKAIEQDMTNIAVDLTPPPPEEELPPPPPLHRLHQWLRW